MHSVAVCALMVALARQLDLPEDQVHEAGMAGLLHDIGKMAMPLDVLNKPGKLSDDEYAIMRSHPERGHAMLLAAQTAVSDAVLDVCLHHHEKVDGTGYPHRLAGEEISLLARMGAICDVYDAITSNRPYKTAWDASGSLARMAQWQGHFDTQLLRAFVRTVGIYPLGSLVRLQSGRLGVVIEHHPQQLTAPRLKLFYSVRTRAAIPAGAGSLQPQCGDRIVGRKIPPPGVSTTWTSSGPSSAARLASRAFVVPDGQTTAVLAVVILRPGLPCSGRRAVGEQAAMTAATAPMPGAGSQQASATIASTCMANPRPSTRSCELLTGKHHDPCNGLYRRLSAGRGGL